MNSVLIAFYILLLLTIIYIIQKLFENKEGFESKKRFIVKRGPEIYDNFYVNIYDDLLYNELKNQYEIKEIVNKTSPTSASKILDIGSGTGHHVNLFNKQGFNACGIDISTKMVEKAKSNYPNCNYKIGDATKAISYAPNTFTHISILYFTIYMVENKKKLFQNCYNWLKRGGYLILHLVDRSKFDPILPVGDVLYGISPQDYSKKRITSTVASFENYDYKANFNIKNEIGVLKETFTNKKTDSVRTQEHQLYMEPRDVIINMATKSGFIVNSISEMKNCGYNNQYLYILQKPKY